MELQQLNQHTFLSFSLRSWSRKSEIIFKNILDCGLSWELVAFFKYVSQLADSIRMNKIRESLNGALGMISDLEHVTGI